MSSTPCNFVLLGDDIFRIVLTFIPRAHDILSFKHSCTSICNALLPLHTVELDKCDNAQQQQQQHAHEQLFFRCMCIGALNDKIEHFKSLIVTLEQQQKQQEQINEEATAATQAPAPPPNQQQSNYYYTRRRRHNRNFNRNPPSGHSTVVQYRRSIRINEKQVQGLSAYHNHHGNSKNSCNNSSNKVKNFKEMYFKFFKFGSIHVEAKRPQRNFRKAEFEDHQILIKSYLNKLDSHHKLHALRFFRLREEEQLKLRLNSNNSKNSKQVQAAVVDKPSTTLKVCTKPEDSKQILLLKHVMELKTTNVNQDDGTIFFYYTFNDMYQHKYSSFEYWYRKWYAIITECINKKIYVVKAWRDETRYSLETHTNSVLYCLVKAFRRVVHQCKLNVKNENKATNSNNDFAYAVEDQNDKNDQEEEDVQQQEQVEDTVTTIVTNNKYIKALCELIDYYTMGLIKQECSSGKSNNNRISTTITSDLVKSAVWTPERNYNTYCIVDTKFRDTFTQLCKLNCVPVMQHYVRIYLKYGAAIDDLVLKSLFFSTVAYDKQACTDAYHVLHTEVLQLRDSRLLQEFKSAVLACCNKMPTFKTVFGFSSTKQITI